jgi:hypothetical protein
MSIKANPRYLFPAPGWKCFQCSIDEDGSSEFMEVPVVGWGVVEGFDCGEDLCKLSEEACPLTHGSEMQLLVALQDAPMEAPMIYPSSELGDLFTNTAFGFLRTDEEFDGDYKTILEKKAHEKYPRQKVPA